MKVRFYCDIPNHGVRTSGQYPWPLVAWVNPVSAVMDGFTRVAFDVDMPPGLVLPPHDAQAPATVAQVIEEGGNDE